MLGWSGVFMFSFFPFSFLMPLFGFLCLPLFRNNSLPQGCGRIFHDEKVLPRVETIFDVWDYCNLQFGSLNGKVVDPCLRKLE